MIYQCRGPVLVAFVYLATANLVIAAQELTPGSEPNLTEEQKEDFLRAATKGHILSLRVGFAIPRRKRVPKESTQVSIARDIKGG
jgi:hypothetical protein